MKQTLNSLQRSRGEHGQEHDWISCRILAIFLDQDWIGYLFLKKIGLG